MSCYFNVSPSKTSVIVHCQVQNCRGYLKNFKKIFTSQVYRFAIKMIFPKWFPVSPLG